MFFYIDWTYIVLILPAFIFSIIANVSVNNAFKKYSQELNTRSMTGYQAARIVLDNYGLHEVRIEMIGGNLSDHYDPRSNVIRLSQSVYNSSSIASVGIACHEVGHAIQYAKKYFPIKIRNAIIPLTNIGSKLSTPLILIGILLSSFGSMYSYIAYAGVILFAFCVVFQLITLPVEFNASKRAIKTLDEANILNSNELYKAKKVLNAAAMTYVAALAVSLAQLLYLLRLVNRTRR